jgi:hypothetical protein
MARHDYSADSAPLPPLSLRPGVSGTRKYAPAEIVRFPALPASLSGVFLTTTSVD